ncbi:MAG: HEAT repeat domain-containing protein [Anaerolineae bacterium]
MSERDDFDFDNLDDDATDDDDFISPELAEERRKAHTNKAKEYAKIIVKPKSYDVNQRREAIRWLGEAGEPPAIPALLRVYQKDEALKDEAAYALGQLKALGLEIDNVETSDQAIDRLNEMIIQDKMPKRLNSLPIIIAEVGLVVLAIVLFSFGLARVNQNANIEATSVSLTQTAQPTPTPDNEDAVQAEVEAYFAALSADANFYQLQLAAVGRGEGLNCQADAINNPSTYNLSATWQDDPRLTAVVTELNDIREILQPVVSDYQEACAAGVAMPRQQAINLGGTVISAQQALNNTLNTLNQSGFEVEAPVFASATPVPTETPDPAVPVPTEDMSMLNTAIIMLERIIFDMTETRGATTLMILNWQQVVENQAIYLSGCNQPEPIIPETVTLEADLVGVSELLDSAVDNVNLGLQSTRESTNAFFASCESGEVPGDAIGRLAQVQLADAAFASATNDLNALQN